MRVVVYPEGSREGIHPHATPHPLDELDRAELGPAHVLVQRTLAWAERDDVRFFEGLRLRGQVPRGSDLYSRSLRRLLAWPRLVDAPDLVIVVVDADGKAKQRRDTTTKHAVPSSASIRVVIAVPVQEIEAWLIADHANAVSVLGSRSTPQTPEKMKPTEAKDIFDDWVGPGTDVERWSKRREVAELCDLDVVAKACASFDRFRKDLRSVL